MPKVKRGQRRRAYRPKTRTGCVTCKSVCSELSPILTWVLTSHGRIRRVKCDETKPSCIKCTSTGRRCDGYILDNQNELTLTSRKIVSCTLTGLLSVDISGTDRERRAFHFFRNRTVPQLSGFYGSEFWDRLVLQAAHAEPAIRHGIFALGSLHECFENGDQHGTAIDQIDFPVQQYRLAINQLLTPFAKHQKQAMDIALASCVIFVVFEMVRGHYGSALAHINSGIKIFCELQINSDSQKLEHPVLTSSYVPYIPLDTFKALYTRLDTQLLQITDQSISDIAQRSRIKKPNNSVPASFSTVSEARDLMEYHWHNYIYLHPSLPERNMVVSPEAINAKNEVYKDLIQQWATALDRFVELRGQNLTLHERIGVLILQIQKCVGFLGLDLKRGVYDDQMLWDKYRSQHEEIVSLAESVSNLMASALGADSQQKPSFSPDNGIVRPLYIVASTCRDPLIRRKAISILRRTTRQEGMWNSQVVASVAERIVAIEEEGLGVVRECSDVPDWARISDVSPSFDIEGRWAVLSYGRFNSPFGSIREAVHEILEW